MDGVVRDGAQRNGRGNFEKASAVDLVFNDVRIPLLDDFGANLGAVKFCDGVVGVERLARDTVYVHEAVNVEEDVVQDLAVIWNSTALWEFTCFFQFILV